MVLDPDWLADEKDGAATLVAAAESLDPSSYEFRETTLTAIYTLAHFPESWRRAPLRQELTPNLTTLKTLASWFNRYQPPDDAPARCALEVGCGPGRMLHLLAPRMAEGAIGLDLRLSMLRVARRLACSGEVTLPFRTEGRRFEPVRIVVQTSATLAPIHLVQGDLTAPPFEPYVFPVVVAMSLLDSVAHPLLSLRHLDGLLAPSGLLLVAMPYHWEPYVTPPDHWWSHRALTGPETLRAALSGKHPSLSDLNYEILATAEDLTWTLPGHRRVVHRFFLDCVLARKKSFPR